jgi:hypothetical protein
VLAPERNREHIIEGQVAALNVRFMERLHLNLVVGQKHNATVGGDMEERIQGLRKSVSGVSQRLHAPKTWLGTEGVNVLQVLCDLLDLVQQMNTQLAAHSHVPGPAPSQTDVAEFSAKALRAGFMAAKLKPITL